MTGVQTCALPIWHDERAVRAAAVLSRERLAEVGRRVAVVLEQVVDDAAIGPRLAVIGGQLGGGREVEVFELPMVSAKPQPAIAQWRSESPAGPSPPATPTCRQPISTSS